MTTAMIPLGLIILTVLPGTVIEKWRVVQHGDGTTSIICDGKTFRKGNNHKDSTNCWTFMYSKFKKKKPTTQSGDTHINKLVVGDKLKEVLCSHLLLGDKDVDDICNKFLNNGKDVRVIGSNQKKD